MYASLLSSNRKEVFCMLSVNDLDERLNACVGGLHVAQSCIVSRLEIEDGLTASLAESLYYALAGIVVQLEEIIIENAFDNPEK